MTQEALFLEDLRAHIARKYKTQTMAAAHWGFSSAYLSKVVRGEKAPNERILKEVGYKRSRQIVYEKIANDR